MQTTQMQTRAVITGATGAVGMALIAELAEQGIETLVLCRKDSARAGQIPAHPLITKADCSLSEMKNFEAPEGKRYDLFFHLAWEGTTGESRNDTHLQNRNVESTLEAVELSHRLGCHTFVGAGSQAEYGRVEGKLNASTPAFPENGYGMAKLCAGQMSRLLCEQLGIKHVWARILSVYGPYDGMGSMVMSTVAKLKRGEKPSFTPAEQMWDYLYSGDAARALLAMATKGRHGGVYCLGSGEPRPLKEYILAIRDAVDPEAPLGIGELPYGNNQVMYLCADLTELRTDTGFEPLVSFEEGIGMTLRQYESMLREQKK